MRSCGGTHVFLDPLHYPIAGETVLLGDGERVGQAVRRLAQDLVGPHGGPVGVHHAHHAHRLLAELRQFVDEGDAHAGRVELHDPPYHLLAEIDCIIEGGRRKDLVEEDDALARGLVEDAAHPDQVLQQPAALGLDPLLSVEMGQ